MANANPFWHLAHPMPRHPTLRQRIAWHRAHDQHCPCLRMPPRLAAIAQKLRRA